MISEKEKLEKAHETAIELSGKLKLVDVSRIGISDSIMDIFCMRISGISLSMAFLDLMSKSLYKADSIQTIKRTLFIAGIVFAKEFPKICDLIYPTNNTETFHEMFNKEIRNVEKQIK